MKRNFTDKQPATWQQHEMRYTVFFDCDTACWLGFLITYEKVTKESEHSVRTFPRRHVGVTCFLNLCLSSLKFTVAVVIVAFAVHACVQMVYGTGLYVQYVHLILHACTFKQGSCLRFFMVVIMACKHLHPLC